MMCYNIYNTDSFPIFLNLTVNSSGGEVMMMFSDEKSGISLYKKIGEEAENFRYQGRVKMLRYKPSRSTEIKFNFNQIIISANGILGFEACSGKWDSRLTYQPNHSDLEKQMEFELKVFHLRRILSDIGKNPNDKICIGFDGENNVWGIFNSHTLKQLTHKPRTQAFMKRTNGLAIVRCNKLDDFLFSKTGEIKGIFTELDCADTIKVGVGSNNELFIEATTFNDNEKFCYVFKTEALDCVVEELMDTNEHYKYSSSGLLADVKNSVRKLQSIQVSFTEEESEMLSQWRTAHLFKCANSGSTPSDEVDKWWMDYFAEQLANSIEVDLEKANELLLKIKGKNI